jgi:hypothetical protein
MLALFVHCKNSAIDKYAIRKMEKSDTPRGGFLSTNFRQEVVTKRVQENPMDKCKAPSKTN